MISAYICIHKHWMTFKKRDEAALDSMREREKSRFYIKSDFFPYYY